MDHSNSECEAVVLGAWPDSIRANLVIIRLAAEGIEAWLSDDYIVEVHPLLLHAVGGVKIWVRAVDLASAQKVLATKPDLTDWEAEGSET